MKNPKSIGARCKHCRDLLGELEGKEVTRGGMKARARLSTGHYEGIEDDKKKAGLDAIEKIADAFKAVHATPEWLAWARGPAPYLPDPSADATHAEE